MGQLDDLALSQADKKRGRASKKKTKKGFGTFRFVNVTLNKQDKEIIRKTELDPYEFYDYLKEWLDAGYKFSIRDNDEKGYYLASLSGVEERCPNKDYIVTARSSSLDECLVALAYKLKEVLPALWSQQLTDMDDTLG